MNQLEMDSGFPWQCILDKLLDRVSNSAGAMHHITLGNKFENWLQVEFVGLLIGQGIASNSITMEKRDEPQEKGYPYWDVLVGGNHDVLVDLKVVKRTTKSNDVSRIKTTLGIMEGKGKTNKVWFVIFAMGYSQAVIWEELLKSFKIEGKIHAASSCTNSKCISLCAVQLSKKA